MCSGVRCPVLVTGARGDRRRCAAARALLYLPRVTCIHCRSVLPDAASVDRSAKQEQKHSTPCAAAEPQSAECEPVAARRRAARPLAARERGGWPRAPRVGHSPRDQRAADGQLRREPGRGVLHRGSLSAAVGGHRNQPAAGEQTGADCGRDPGVDFEHQEPSDEGGFGQPAVSVARPAARVWCDGSTTSRPAWPSRWVRAGPQHRLGCSCGRGCPLHEGSFVAEPSCSRLRWRSSVNFGRGRYPAAGGHPARCALSEAPARCVRL